MPTPPSFHASPLPSNKAGSSAHCRVMNTGNMFQVLTPCILEESSYKIMIYRASRWRLRQRTHIKARNKPATEPENFAAVTGVYSLSLFSFFSFFSIFVQQTLILVNLMTVSDGKKLFCYALTLCENGSYIANLFSRWKFNFLPLILCDAWIFMLDFFVIIESYVCNLGILILITIIQKYLDKMY